MTTYGVVLAGGVGARVGSELPKQLLEVSGRTILEHSVAAFASHPRIDEVLVVMVPGHVDVARRIVKAYPKVAGVVEAGVGAPRSDSTVRALSWIGSRGDGEPHVLLHDAARPLVTADLIDRAVAALATYDAATAAIPSSDTILELAPDGTLHNVPSRANLRRVQTPQAFRVSVLRRAHELAAQDPSFEPTDDCSVVLRYLPDVPIGVFDGDERNIKVTEPLDLAVAELLLGER